MRRVRGGEADQAGLRRGGHRVEFVKVGGIGERVRVGVPYSCFSHGIFKPPLDDFLSELNSKDRRSEKKWEYVN